MIKAYEKGYCCEILIQDHFIHICSLKEGHEKLHKCACGQTMTGKMDSDAFET